MHGLQSTACTACCDVVRAIADLHFSIELQLIWLNCEPVKRVVKQPESGLTLHVLIA